MKKILAVFVIALACVTVLGMAVSAATYYSTYPEDGVYYIQSACGNNMVLDVYGVSSDDGANITIYQKNNGDNQKFKIERKGNYYTMTALHSGKRVDVYGASSVSGANINQWSANNSAAQLWKFFDAGNGYYYIRSALLTVMDVYGAGTANGTNVTTYSFHGGKNQMWKLVPAEDSLSTKISSFINDSRWKPGTYWNGNQTPKSSNVDDTKSHWGCNAYACDFVAEVYGKSRISSGKRFYSTSEIKAGDVLYLSPTHWVVVVSRTGNSIDVVHGNWGKQVRRDTCTISGRKIGGIINRTMVEGYHYY